MQWTDLPITNDLNVKRRILAVRKNVNKIMMENNMIHQNLYVQVVAQKECLIQTAGYMVLISLNLSANFAVPLLHGFAGAIHIFEIAVILDRITVIMFLEKRRVIYLSVLEKTDAL